jgi:putative peptidoglycan lipid II flippase
MVKGFRQIASLTVISRVFGLIRDMTFSYFFGAGWLMTAWTMGFKIPNLARRLFGEGAASASFIPVYSEQLHKDPQQSERLRNTVVTVLLVVLVSIVLVGQGLVWGYYRFFADNTGTRLGLTLCSIMLPYMIFVCIVAILAGILNVHRHFAAPAAAPIVLNIFIISSLLITGFAFSIPPAQQVFFVAFAVVIAGMIQVLIQVPPLRGNGISIRPAWGVRTEAFKKIVFMMGPMILGLTVTQINTLADDVVALSFSNDQGNPLGWGSVSYLYYAQRLYQFPLGVLGISLATAIFPVMSAEAARGDLEALCKTISKGIKGAVFIAIPATAGLIIVARPLVSVIFERGEFTAGDTKMVAWTLCFYSLGLSGYFSQQIVTRAFYSMQDSKMPAVTAVVAVFVNVVLNLILIWFLGTGGLALSTAVCSYLQVTILIVVLRRRFGHSILKGMTITIVKTLLGTAVMCIAGIVVLYLMSDLPAGACGLGFDLLRLAVVVPLSAVIYTLASKMLKNRMLSLITGARKAEQ